MAIHVFDQHNEPRKTTNAEGFGGVIGTRNKRGADVWALDVKNSTTDVLVGHALDGSFVVGCAQWGERRGKVRGSETTEDVAGDKRKRGDLPWAFHIWSGLDPME